MPVVSREGLLFVLVAFGFLLTACLSLATFKVFFTWLCSVKHPLGGHFVFVWGFLSCCGCYNAKPFFLLCVFRVSPLAFHFLYSGKSHVSVHLFLVLFVCFVLLFYAFYLVQFTCLLVCFTFRCEGKPYLLINRYSFNNILFMAEEMVSKWIICSLTIKTLVCIPQKTWWSAECGGIAYAFFYSRTC